MRSCDFQMLSWPVGYQTNDAIGILESFHEENTTYKCCIEASVSIYSDLDQRNTECTENDESVCTKHGRLS